MAPRAPRPTYEFSIPSIYDDKALACRIYSLPELYFGGPKEFRRRRNKTWTPRGAVVAHAYTSLGGSYNDNVVRAVVGELLAQGFTVGTFNLR